MGVEEGFAEGLVVDVEEDEARKEVGRTGGGWREVGRGLAGRTLRWKAVVKVGLETEKLSTRGREVR